MKRIDLRIILSFLLAALALASCTRTEPVAEQTPPGPTEPPFENTEPEVYQTFVIQTLSTGPVKFFIARSGDNWRIDSDLDGANRTASLRLDGKDYVLDFGSRSYGEYTSGHGFDERAETVREVTFGLINGRDVAVYERNGQGYRSKDDKGREVNITLDEQGRPVSKEIYRDSDGGRVREIRVELNDFKLLADPAHFDIPKDFKKVTMAEMKNILTKAR